MGGYRGENDLGGVVDPDAIDMALVVHQRDHLEREFFIDNLLVRIHFIIGMIRWTGLVPWEFEFPFPGSLTSTFLDPEVVDMAFVVHQRDHLQKCAGDPRRARI